MNSSCASEEKKNKSQLLGNTAQKRLELAMDELIPASAKMPAASEVNTMGYISKVLQNYPDLLVALEELISSLNELSIATTNDDFENLSSASRIEVLKQFEKDQSSMFSVLRDFVYEGYYINEQVWELIGYEPYPTMSAGPQMEPFDEAVLERVKQMSAIYLKV